MDAQMKIYSPYERKGEVVYTSWEQVFKAYLDLLKKIDGEYNSPRRFSFIELYTECEFWQSDVSNFIKSLGIKNDEGFSRSRMFPLRVLRTDRDKRLSGGGVVTDSFFGKDLEEDKMQELKKTLHGKCDILRVIKDSNTVQSISKNKINKSTKKITITLSNIGLVNEKNGKVYPVSGKREEYIKILHTFRSLHGKEFQVKVSQKSTNLSEGIKQFNEIAKKKLLIKEDIIKSNNKVGYYLNKSFIIKIQG